MLKRMREDQCVDSFACAASEREDEAASGRERRHARHCDISRRSEVATHRHGASRTATPASSKGSELRPSGSVPSLAAPCGHRAAFGLTWRCDHEMSLYMYISCPCTTGREFYQQYGALCSDTCE